jgi:hypothetical protein
VIRNEFAVHMLNEDAKDKAKVIASNFSNLLTALEDVCGTPDGHRGPGGREMAIVRTKLEEACFFAKKAMAAQPTNVVAP